jgi:predicted ferric reductase
VIRAARVVAFNRKFWTVHGQATFDPASNMVRLEVSTASSMYRVRPGTFFYLMTLDDTAFWESHPFTVASVSTFGRDEDYLGEASPLLEASDASDGRPKRMTMYESMTFLIRPYNSFTSRLRDRAEAHWPKPAHVRMAVDGPYGRTLALDLFSRVVFVVGGSGIVVALSYIRVLLDSSRCQNIDIHWSVREPALAREIIQRDLREALGHEKVSLNFYMTGADDRAESEASADVVWHWQRMNPTALIEATTTPGASSSQPSLAIVACGPAKMADETRCASVAAMRRAESGTRVEYFEESFQW